MNYRSSVLSKYNYSILDAMLDDMSTAASFYQPTHFWRKAVYDIAEEIHTQGIAEFRSLPSALRFFVPTYGTVEYLLNPASFRNNVESLCALSLESAKLSIRVKQLLSGELQALADYRTFLASNNYFSPEGEVPSESTIGFPLEQFEFFGKRFSRSFLNYLMGLNFFYKVCSPKKINTVLEIGGGYGSLGEILLSNNNYNVFYINIDIPPTAFVATYYLQSLFGQDAIGDYQTLRQSPILDINELRKRLSAIILCPWQLPRLSGQIDLFVNYISFQEMEPDIVENYLNYIRQLSARYILLRNLHEGKQAASENSTIGVDHPITAPDYDHFLPEYELIACNTIPFGYKTEDGYHSELRVYKRYGC